MTTKEESMGSRFTLRVLEGSAWSRVYRSEAKDLAQGIPTGQGRVEVWAGEPEVWAGEPARVIER